MDRVGDHLFAQSWQIRKATGNQVLSAQLSEARLFLTRLYNMPANRTRIGPTTPSLLGHASLTNLTGDSVIFARSRDETTADHISSN